MTPSIVGAGTWLPDTVRTNDAWPESFVRRGHAQGDRTFNDIPPSEDPVAQALVERHLAAEATDPFLGASHRHVADASTAAVEAEANAALHALRDADIAPADVDLLLSYSVVPDRFQPTGPSVAHRIGAHRAHAVGIDTACASSIAQLEIARAYVTAGLAKVVLLVQSHLYCAPCLSSIRPRPGSATARAPWWSRGVLGSFCAARSAIRWASSPKR
jgi:3-oxoacyl-[acyl-carrier-protein] synthase III